MRRDLFGLFGGKRGQDSGRVERILLYESEAVRITQYAQSSPNAEIGGDLFGYFAPDGSRLVFVASGPGPAARRDTTHFRQDPQFQSTVFNELATKFRMFYVGDWHSHHRLHLSEPSRSDDAKLQDLASKNGWPQLFSLIVQTEYTPRHLNQYAGHRKGVSQADSESDGMGRAVEAFGVWWNVFQYTFTESKHARRRITIEFQSGENPYDATSRNINAPLEKGAHQRSYEVGGPVSADAHPRWADDGAGVSVECDEFTLGIYQRICRALSGELDRAEMEVDLEYPGGASLLVLDGGKKVICGIHGTADTPLAVTVDSIGREQVAFKVPCRRGVVGPVDIGKIVEHIIEQFKSPTDPG